MPENKNLSDILRIKNQYKGQIELMTSNARKSNSKLRPDGFIYIVKLKGFDIYKIGVSAKPQRRIKDIDSNSPFGINVICLKFFKNVYNFEECIHDSFKDCIMRKEWFKIDSKSIKILIKQINKLSDKGFYLIRK